MWPFRDNTLLLAPRLAQRAARNTKMVKMSETFWRKTLIGVTELEQLRMPMMIRLREKVMQQLEDERWKYEATR